LVCGTGSIGARHARNIKVLRPDIDLVFLRRNGGRDELSTDLNARVVSCLEDGIATDPDFVVIATPSDSHLAPILACIRNNLPFYIEKPIVVSGLEISLIRDELSKCDYRKPTLTGCNLRFLGSLRTAKSLIANGVLGEIARASFQAGQWLPDWRPSQDYRLSYSADPDRGGSVLWDLIHEIDSAIFLLGDFDQVSAMTRVFDPLGMRSEAVATLMLANSKGGPLVGIGLDYVARTLVRRYEIIGQLGTLVWDLPSRSMSLQRAERVEVITTRPEDFDVSATYVDAMREFIHAVRLGTQTSHNIERGLKSVEIALQAKGGV
jgi:predicted dehydrogenase